MNLNRTGAENYLIQSSRCWKEQFNVEKGMYGGAIGAIISLYVAEINLVKEEYGTTLIAQTGSRSTQVAVRTQGALHNTPAGPGCSYFGGVL